MKLKCFVIMLFILMFASNVYSENNIKFGVILPITDVVGVEGVKAMKLAVKQINESGGLLGKQVELIITDDEMKAEKAVACLDRLVTVDNVDIIVGGYGSAPMMAMIPSMKKYEKIVVFSGVASIKVEEVMKGQNWFFHLHEWDYERALFWKTAWNDIQKKYKKVKISKDFIIYEEGVFGNSIFNTRVNVNPEINIQGVPFKSSTGHSGGGDYRAQLRHAQNFKPDRFAWIGYGNDAFPMMEQMKEIGFAPKIVSATPVTWPLNFEKSNLSEGIVYVAGWTKQMAISNKESKIFLNDYVKEYGEAPVSYMTPLYYTNIMIVADAIRRTGTLNKDELITSLEKTKYNSPFGEIVFQESKYIKHQASISSLITQFQNGKLEIIYPWKYATAKLIYPFPKWENRK
jgi:branched-chain amino acid transport system substrate-binding protein